MSSLPPEGNAVWRVVHQAWILMDNTEHDMSTGERNIEPDDFEALSDAMDYLESLVPDSEGPFWGGYPVSYLWPKSTPLKDDDVQWITNDNGELGVMIHGQSFFLYKGRSLVYKDAQHDDGSPMHYRPVFKREFGECAHPINYNNPELVGHVSLDDSDDWKPLPPASPEQISGPSPEETQDG